MNRRFLAKQNNLRKRNLGKEVTIPCIECDSTGKIETKSKNESGEESVVLSDCTVCNGKGLVKAVISSEEIK